MIQLLPVLALLLAPARAASLNDAPSLSFERHVLANGLTVLLHADPTMPRLVAVNVWYKVGSRDEKPGKTGFAHLFEHYMFEGSEHAPNGGYDKAIFACGGTDNASTSQDRTDYYAIVPTDCLDQELFVEADRMGHLSINQAGLDKQRPIVENEKRQREGGAYGTTMMSRDTYVFDASHPYGHTVIGSMEDLERATLDDVKSFHDTYYWPNNAVLVVSGNDDPAHMLALVQKHFGPLPAGPTPPAPAFPAFAPLDGRREAALTDARAQLPLLLMLYRIPGEDQPGWQEIGVAAAILGSGRSSWLKTRLKDKRQLVSDIGAGTSDLQGGGLLMIEAVPAPGVPLETLEAAIRAELDRFIEQGPSAADMRRVKAQMRLSTLDALQEASGLAQAMAEGQVVSGNPADFATQLSKMRAMSRRAPQAAARRYLSPSNTSVIKTLPAGAHQ